MVEVGTVTKETRMQSSIKTFEELKKFYNKLDDKYEGYIQMSDSRINNIFIQPNKLPKWKELHNDINYILEMALYEPKSKKSILIRQINDKWSVIEKYLNENDLQNSDDFFTIKYNIKARIVQIWQKEEDDFCLGLETLIPKTLFFAGFEGEKS